MTQDLLTLVISLVLGPSQGEQLTELSLTAVGWFIRPVTTVIMTVTEVV